MLRVLPHFSYTSSRAIWMTPKEMFLSSKLLPDLLCSFNTLFL